MISARATGGGREPAAAEIPVVRMVAREGQRHHVAALPAELAALPLRDVARRFRIAADDGEARFVPLQDA